MKKKQLRLVSPNDRYHKIVIKKITDFVRPQRQSILATDSANKNQYVKISRLKSIQ